MVESLRNALDVFLAYIPQLIGAIVILIVGYLVARALQAVVSRVLQTVGFDNWMERRLLPLVSRDQCLQAALSELAVPG
jgi:hypothetical protein